MNTAVKPPVQRAEVPNDLSAFWMPFTTNRAFKKKPRLISRAKDMHYYTPEGRAVLDGTAGLWCCNAGHNRPSIVAAIQNQAAELDFSPTFSFAHPLAFQLASRIAELAPGDLDHVFYCNSGSEACDTALKIALAYHNVRGRGFAHAPDRPRARLSRRRLRRGTSVGGMVNNRKALRFAARQCRPSAGNLQSRASGLHQRRAGMGRASGRCARGHRRAARCVHHRRGDRRADGGLDRGSAGAQGVSLRRLRDICDKHGILLIFDEVITGFGRLGAPFAAERYGVQPDLITFAKGVTSGTVPMGGVIARKHVYDAFMNGPESVIELFHGYTYSGHPLSHAPQPWRRWMSIATSACSSAPRRARAQVV